MTKKSNSSKTKNTDISAVKRAREIRLNYYKSLKKEESYDSREEFRKFFIMKKHELSLDPSLEEVIWLHFKAHGFDKKEKFEEGLKHFGY